MAQEKVNFSGDASQLEKEYDKLHARMLKMEEQLVKQTKKATEGNQKMSRELQQLARDAEQVTKAVETPLERYSQKVAKLDQLLAKGKITQETYNRAVAQARQAITQTAEVQESTFSAGLTNVARMATGWLSVTAAIQTAIAALKEQQQLEREVQQKQVSTAAAQEDVIGAMTGATSQERRQMLAAVQGVQQRTGFRDINTLYRAAAGGLAAGLDAESTISALEAAVPLSPNNPENIPTLVAAAGDIRRATGNVDARENLQFIAAIGAEARVESLRDSARSVAPAVASSLIATPDTDRRRAAIQAGALFAALSNRTTDPTGRTTSTATTKLTGSLASFFEKGITEGSGKRARTFQPASDPGTLAGRIETLQQNPELAEAFLRNTTFEEAFKLPIAELVRGRGLTAEEFRTLQGRINFSGGEYEGTVRDLATLTPELRMASQAGATAGRLQEFDLESSLAARRAAVRENVTGVLQRTAPGLRGYLPRRQLGAVFEAGMLALPDAPEAVGIQTLEMEEERIRRTGSRQVGLQTFLNRPRADEQLTEAEREQIELLRDMRDQLRASLSGQAAAGAAAAIAEKGRHLEK